MYASALRLKWPTLKCLWICSPKWSYDTSWHNTSPTGEKGICSKASSSSGQAWTDVMLSTLGSETQLGPGSSSCARSKVPFDALFGLPSSIAYSSLLPCGDFAEGVLLSQAGTAEFPSKRGAKTYYKPPSSDFSAVLLMIAPLSFHFAKCEW